MRLSAKCSTYASSLAVTAQTFTLTIAMRPDPFWTGASLVGFGFNGGESILVQAANLDPGATYACGFTRRIEDAACVCESDGTSCQVRLLLCLPLSCLPLSVLPLVSLSVLSCLLSASLVCLSCLPLSLVSVFLCRSSAPRQAGP